MTGKPGSNPLDPLDEGTKTGRPRICSSSGEVALAADSMCQPCVCSDTYLRLTRTPTTLSRSPLRGHHSTHFLEARFWTVSSLSSGW